MLSYEDLFLQLEAAGLNGNDTVLIHSSMKKIGEVDGGAETTLDVFSDFFNDGLLVLPTHTWSYIGKDNPKFYVQSSTTCVGVLTEIFRKRKDVHRSWHPTHSVAARGNHAKTFIEGDHLFDTPCARGSVYGKLLDRKAYILLIGVDLTRNTFMHGIEEWIDIPGRLTDTHEQLYTVLSHGVKISVPSRRHYGLSWSEHFWKVEEDFLKYQVMTIAPFGDTEMRICNTVKMTELLTEMLKLDEALFSTNDPLSEDFRSRFEVHWLSLGHSFK